MPPVMTTPSCCTRSSRASRRDSHADHPPSSRFLRARRFVPADAYTQFKETEQWREINKIDQLYYNIDVDNYDEARRLVSTQCRSRGIPDCRADPLFRA